VTSNFSVAEIGTAGPNGLSHKVVGVGGANQTMETWWKGNGIRTKETNIRGDSTGSKKRSSDRGLSEKGGGKKNHELPGGHRRGEIIPPHARRRWVVFPDTDCAGEGGNKLENGPSSSGARITSE